MKKNIILLGALMLSSLAYSQVGINNESPQATLDVTAKTTDGTKPEGIIAPRLTGEEIKGKDTKYLAPQTGTIVYATGASSDAGVSGTKTININGAGYYYFDGTIWQKFSGAAAAGTDDWHVTGNSGTTPGANFLGTTDAKDLMFKVNNTKSGLIGASVGTTAGADWETSFGNSAGLANTTGDDNTFISAIAGTANTTGRANTVVGSRGLATNVTGEANVAIGAYTLYNTNKTSGTTGSSNMAVGTNALFSNTSGSLNSGIGDGALYATTTGNWNTGIGQKAFEQNTTGSNNTGIGALSDIGTGNLTNATAVGSLSYVE